jgi:dTDP-4-amino-4,6-dideoxygalactose transaminase
VSPSVPQIADLCRARSLHLVEDAAQAHGSALGGRAAGSFGRAAGFSFFSTKVMTTGEGGMVTTDDPELAAAMRSMREFGKVRDGVYVNRHERIGYNWRLPEVAALLGLRQLDAIGGFLERRRTIARWYDQLLAGMDGVEHVKPTEPDSHNYFKYTLLLRRGDRTQIHRQMAELGVQLSGYVYELPLHRQPVFPWAHQLRLPVTEEVCARHICLPIYPDLERAQVEYVAETLRNVIRAHG